ncbi:putative DNA (cytosine-5)-methyltransferase CMT1 [Trifolium repens]|nr:putative DNA (cytosine-5)-methyltransferase CMT1 [Trifolium repens]
MNTPERNDDNMVEKEPISKKREILNKRDNSGDGGNGGGRRLKSDVAWKKIYYHSSTLPFLQRRRTTDNKKLKKHDKIINQGFNDSKIECCQYLKMPNFKIFRPVKQRYMQVGNTVAIPVARALRFNLGLAF